MDSPDTKIEQIISKVISKQATDEERQYLLQAMRKDPDVRKLYKEFKNVWDITHPPFAEEEIDVRRSEAAVMERIRNRGNLPRVLSLLRNVAAILTIPLLISTTLFYLESRKNEQAVVSSASQEVIAPYGTYSLIHLPDSSRVWLNSGASLKYPVAFADSKREVELSGEAFFEVESNPENPFIVKTEKMEVNAIGTAFNVEARKGDSITAVTMAEGKVDILIGNQYAASLSAAERISFNHLSKKYDVEENTSSKWYAWKDGKMVFRDDPLEQVFKRIGQTYNINIKVTDPVIAKHLYRATFEDESLDEILKLLEMTAPIRYIDTRDTHKQGQNQYKQREIEVQRVR